MIYQTSEINFNLMEINHHICTFQYSFVYQPDDKTIVEHCKKHYPEVIVIKPYTELELVQLNKMRQYIKKTFNDIDTAVKHFFDEKWFYPLVPTDGVVSFTVNKFDCKMWDSELPFLHLYGTITIDLKAVVDSYIKNKFLKLKKKKTFWMNVSYELLFSKDCPYILRSTQHPRVVEQLLLIVEKYLNDTSGKNPLIKQLIHDIKIPKIGTFNKKISWRFPLKLIEIEIDDYIKMSKVLVGGNAAALGIGGLLIKKFYDKDRQNGY